MSECVVRMEMPTSCEKCPACDYEEGNCLLADDRNTLPHNGKRRSWCPIICALPENHGRLVDADAIIAVMDKCAETPEDSVAKLCYSYTSRILKEAITIVPAESSENK